MKQGDLVQFNPRQPSTTHYPVADKIEIFSRSPHEAPNHSIGWIEDGEICIYLERTVFNGFGYNTPWYRLISRFGEGWAVATWFEAISETG